MMWGGPEFVLGIIGLSTGGWLINNWIRARHGYALEDEWGGKTVKPDAGREQALAEENAMLREKLDRTLDRLANVERIVTDKGYTVAAEIEALRDRPANAIANREHAQ